MFEWIQSFAEWLTYSIIDLTPDTRFAEAFEFFVYDTLKILALLFAIVFIMSLVNSYFPVARLRSFLQSRNLFGLEYFAASLFGAITPFCSCSSVPLFIGFVQGGIPIGVTFSFLITSPLVNEVAIAMFIGLFGFKTTLIYAGTGIILGTTGGWLLGKLNLEPLLSDWTKKILENNSSDQRKTYSQAAESFTVRLKEISEKVWDIIRGVLIYVLIGIGIGAVMHGYVPENFFVDNFQIERWWTIPAAVILAIPMYANAAAIVPVIEVFVSKGVPLGTAIAFMMAAVGLSFPEATLLKKVMGWSLIGIFFSVVSILIIFSGYFFNAIL